MKNQVRTTEKYGYDITSLSKSSHKKFIINCDYCSSEYELSMKDYNLRDNSIVNKDCCIKCKYKKREEVTLLRDGVTNSAKRQDVRQKISELNSERLKSEEFKSQAEETNLLLYGDKVAMKTTIVKDRLKNSLLNKYGVENISQLPEKRIIATKNMLKTRIANGTIRIFDGKTYPTIAEETGFSKNHFNVLVNKFGIEEAIMMTPHQSSLEKIFEDWLLQEKIEYEKQFRVEGKIADFKVGNLLIELDGLYWHSDAAKLNKNYHKIKRDIYIKNGFSPLFFRSNEIEQNFDIVKSIIFNKLNLSNKIMARKCTLNKVPKDAAMLFLNQNHLMGAGRGDSYGLYYNNELVSLAQIKQSKKEENSYELSRFCNKLNYSVIGGMSRLIKFSGVKDLTTFIDLRYGSGQYLSSLGFKYVHEYLSFKWTNGREIFNRMKFPGLTGYDNKLNRIWDCGQAKWRLIKV